MVKKRQKTILSEYISCQSAVLLHLGMKSAPEKEFHEARH